LIPVLRYYSVSSRLTYFSLNPEPKGVPVLDEIRKKLPTGLGAILLTKDKIEEITRRLVKVASGASTSLRFADYPG
jgi:hypothetical protein